MGAPGIAAGKPLVNQAASIYARLAGAASSLQSVFLLGVRLYWGWQFAQTGWGKAQHLEKVTGFFASLSIPFPALNAFCVSWTELLGGVCLALGLGSRFWAFLLAADMFVAYLTDGKDQLHAFFSDPGKFYSYDAFTFLYAALIVLFFGPGRIAIDELLRRRYVSTAPI
jgi:putative oxidoreductase